jgi:hypothetical protein
LIDRAAMMMLKLSLIDRKIIDNEPFTLVDNNCTIAWQNALTRVLVALGVNGTVTKPPADPFEQLRQHLSDRAAAAAPAGARGQRHDDGQRLL